MLITTNDIDIFMAHIDTKTDVVKIGHNYISFYYRVGMG